MSDSFGFGRVADADPALYIYRLKLNVVVKIIKTMQFNETIIATFIGDFISFILSIESRTVAMG